MHLINKWLIALLAVVLCTLFGIMIAYYYSGGNSRYNFSFAIQSLDGAPVKIETENYFSNDKFSPVTGNEVLPDSIQVQWYAFDSMVMWEKYFKIDKQKVEQFIVQLPKDCQRTKDEFNNRYLNTIYFKLALAQYGKIYFSIQKIGTNEKMIDSFDAYRIDKTITECFLKAENDLFDSSISQQIDVVKNRYNYRFRLFIDGVKQKNIPIDISKDNCYEVTSTSFVRDINGYWIEDNNDDGTIQTIETVGHHHHWMQQAVYDTIFTNNIIPKYISFVINGIYYELSDLYEKGFIPLLKKVSEGNNQTLVYIDIHIKNNDLEKTSPIIIKTVRHNSITYAYKNISIPIRIFVINTQTAKKFSFQSTLFRAIKEN